MNRFFIFIVLVFLSNCVIGQAPGKFNYQAVARNTSGNLIINQAISVRISILTGSTTGASEYTETHSATTDSYGVFNLLVGGGTVVSGSFNAITWGTASKFLKIEADVTGGTTYQTLATTQILSAPYALYANKAGSTTETQNLSNVISIGNTANAQIKSLTDPTDAQDAATKAYVDAVKTQIENLLITNGVMVKDYEGNVYNTVTIGTQTWFRENLKSTIYNDGTSIPLVTNNTAWSALTSAAYCWYSNDEITNKDSYGALFTFYVVVTGKICPIGWHVPTDAEWTQLITYIGGESIAGGKLKEAGTAHWDSPNNADNSSNFTALPGGYRGTGGSFFNLKNNGHWWSSTENTSTDAWFRYMQYNNTIVSKPTNPKNSGFSVRCLKD